MTVPTNARTIYKFMAEKHPIRVDQRAKAVVERESKIRHMDQKKVASLVLHWFGDADESVRAVVLKQVDPSQVVGFRDLLLRSFDLK